jgi:hypothetical protein
MDVTYFKFENDFVEENIRCIPMIVRFKLDVCGIKLKLSEWSRMNKKEREMLAELPMDTREEIFYYRAYLKDLIFARTGSQATELTAINTTWATTNDIPEDVVNNVSRYSGSLSLMQWQQLTDLQRFALIKLSQSSHEHKNLPKALREFELLG